MKVLVAYMSQTGNTKKVAEAIYDEITCEKEIKPIKEVQDIGAYDLSFLGFPTHGSGPDKKAREFLGRHCKDGRKVALFVTHGAAEHVPDVPEWMANFRGAVAGANIVGFFDCQGEISKGAKFVMRIHPDEKVRGWAKVETSKGQPDEARLEKARAFARDTLNRIV
ncbi:MAG: flavodoxin family protein [Methanomassiliicoccales archaeon]|nr:flavodoxin family protein [Methanomassiliicoccales archaeon]